MLNALEVVTTVSVGLMVGVEFSVAFVINSILNALPEDSSQLGHAHGGRMLGAAMPVWYLSSLVLVVIWAIAGRHHGTGLVVAAGALLLLSVIMSVLLLVPINNRNKTWTPENRPADWQQQIKRWNRYHYVPRRRHHRRLRPAGRLPRLT
ncbi:LOW QUALITY PROTEIN: membrane protein, partial [Streptomyces viridochromogenes DSM 40736]